MPAKSPSQGHSDELAISGVDGSSLLDSNSVVLVALLRQERAACSGCGWARVVALWGQ